MPKFFSVIFMNFWGYDLIIFIAALLTAFLYYKLRHAADELYDKMHLTVFVPDGGASRDEAESDISGIRETDLVTMRNHTGKLYSVFVNMTGIFPLLGILGTVVSLLGLVADTTDITGNFYGALTSTFWGLIFAIIFKFIDGIISAKIEDNEKTVALYLERNNRPDRIESGNKKRDNGGSVRGEVYNSDGIRADVSEDSYHSPDSEYTHRDERDDVSERYESAGYHTDAVDDLIRTLGYGDDER